MSVDICQTAFFPTSGGQNKAPPGPLMPIIKSQKNLAVATLSSEFTGPGVLQITSTTKVRVDVQVTGTNPDPDNSGCIAPAEVPIYLYIPAGAYKLKANTWS